MVAIAIYPGTFDPITYGHLDLVKRGSAMADKLILAVAADTDKDSMFSYEERKEMAEEEIHQMGADYARRIEVMAFSGLLVNFAQEQGATVIIRGLRAVSDFEYEFQMACMNTRLNSEIQTVFLPASEHMQFVSSRFIKQICRLGGDVSEMAPPKVVEKLKHFYAHS